jgi:hypothetical protein
MKPFSGSLFSLRQNFESIFPDLYQENIAMLKHEEDKKNAVKSHGLFSNHHEDAKVYKIKYSLNILPSMNDACEDDLMEAIIRSDEMIIFESEGVIDMVDYKWTAFAFKRHMIGAFFHAIYLGCLLAYINHTFLVDARHHANGLRENPVCSIWYMYILFGCLVYPTIYDGT